MTVGDAGRLGGRRLVEKYGREHMAELGRKVGAMLLDERGVDFFREMAHAGGTVTASRYGHEHYANLGRIGGNKLKEARGKEYYQEIGRKGGLSPKRQRNQTSAGAEV